MLVGTMGAPTSVILANSAPPFLASPRNARTYKSNFTTGTGNIICPAPPLGYVRFTGVGGQTFLGAYNRTGGNVDWIMNRGALPFGAKTAQSDLSWYGLAPATVLFPGVDLTMDFTGGGGGGGMDFNVSYYDVPDDGTYGFTAIVVADTPTTAIPAAPSGKANVLLFDGQLALMSFYNFDPSNAVDLLFEAAGDPVMDLLNISPGSLDVPSAISNMGYVADASKSLTVTGSITGLVNMFVAYKTVDLSQP